MVFISYGMLETAVYIMENLQGAMKGEEIFKRCDSSSESLNILGEGILALCSHIHFFKTLKHILIIRLMTSNPFHFILQYLTENVFCLLFLCVPKVKQSTTSKKKTH
jgi:hypothetical protein